MNDREQMILGRLDKVRKTGTHKYIACCPAHDDKTPSLSLYLPPDGKYLLHCFAQCDALDVVHAMGLTLTDLFPDGAIGGWQAELKRGTPAHNDDHDTLRWYQELRQAGKRLTPEQMKHEERIYLRTRT